MLAFNVMTITKKSLLLFDKLAQSAIIPEQVLFSAYFAGRAIRYR